MKLDRVLWALTIPVLFFFFSCKKKPPISTYVPNVKTLDVNWKLDTINWSSKVELKGYISNFLENEITETGMLLSSNPININNPQYSYKIISSKSDSISCSSPRLSPDVVHYVRAYVKIKNKFFYGEEKSFTSKTIGEHYSGGVIFYLFQPNDNRYVNGELHGIVASDSDLGQYKFGCSGNEIQGSIYFVNNEKVGFAEENTTVIRNSCGGNTGAIMCYNSTKAGYTDWWLPTLNELELMFEYRDLIGGFNISNQLPEQYSRYWSSTEVNANLSWDRTFTGSGTGGGADVADKSLLRSVRAIRYF